MPQEPFNPARAHRLGDEFADALLIKKTTEALIERGYERDRGIRCGSCARSLRF